MFKFKVKGVDEASGKMKDAVALGTENGMEKIGLRGEQLVKEHTPHGATGNLANSIFAEMHKSGELISEIIAEHPPADVYVAPVESGSQPHFPPTSALELWVKQKLHVTDEKTAKAVAFLIARKIAKRGTKGAHMFDLAEKQLSQEAQGILEHAIAEALRGAGFGASS